MTDLTIEVKNDEMLGRTTEKALHITLIEQQKEIKRLNKEKEDLQQKFNYLMEAHKISDEENERLNNIINTLEDSIVGKINVLYQVKGQSNAIRELNILLRQLRELTGEDNDEQR